MPNTNIYYFIFLIILCFGRTHAQSELVLISKTKIEIKEPSGLAYHNGSLYVVGDSKPVMYQMTTKGEVVSEKRMTLNGLEGVTFDETTQNFVIISESKRSMSVFSLKHDFEKTHKIKGKQSKENKGLEGICYHSKNKSLYIVNEAKPKQLLKITAKGKIKKKYDLEFSDDISGIVYDALLDVFWVLSDESQALYKVTSKGKMLEKLPLKIMKPEGIALDEHRQLYIVSDATSELFVYQLK